MFTAGCEAQMQTTHARQSQTKKEPTCRCAPLRCAIKRNVRQTTFLASGSKSCPKQQSTVILQDKTWVFALYATVVYVCVHPWHFSTEWKWHCQTSSDQWLRSDKHQSALQPTCSSTLWTYTLLGSVHTTRVHRPSSWLVWTALVNTARKQCSQPANTGSVCRPLVYGTDSKTAADKC